MEIKQTKNYGLHSRCFALQAVADPAASAFTLFHNEIQQTHQYEKLNEQKRYLETEGSVAFRVFIHLVRLIHVIFSLKINF